MARGHQIFQLVLFWDVLQVGNNILELDTVGRQFEPYQWLVVWPGKLFPNSSGNKAAENLCLWAHPSRGRILEIWFLKSSLKESRHTFLDTHARENYVLDYPFGKSSQFPLQGEASTLAAVHDPQLSILVQKLHGIKLDNTFNANYFVTLSC